MLGERAEQCALLHSPMYLIVDAHQDLAWNMLTFGRDYRRSAAETRALERSSLTVERNGDTLLGWPEYQRGHVAIVFATLFAAPTHARRGEWEPLVYAHGDYETAHRLYWKQQETYHRLCDQSPDHFSLIGSRADLGRVLHPWQTAGEGPVGLVVLMEGADGIRSPDELVEWWQGGVRLIGLAWAGTRYSGGTHQPGPLTAEGRRLLNAMAEFPFLLDLSHMDEVAALEALDRYEGPIVVTHANCQALLKGLESNRHLSDRVIAGLIERGGVIGVVPYNAFLSVGWSYRRGSRREEVSLAHLADHVDHICQIAGNARHVGLGSDFDGGFGVQSVPIEIDTIADLQKLADFLRPRGYTEEEIAAILGGNWLRHLQENLPT